MEKIINDNFIINSWVKTSNEMYTAKENNRFIYYYYYYYSIYLKKVNVHYLLNL